MPILDSEHLPAVTAGAPRAAEECRNLPRLNDLESVLNQFESRPDYFVRVEGDSLDQAGFASGDIVAVRKQPEASDGDIVLARIGAEVTLKRYQRVDAEHVELQPVSTNPDHQTIEVGRAPTTRRSSGSWSGRSSGRGARATETTEVRKRARRARRLFQMGEDERARRVLWGKQRSPRDRHEVPTPKVECAGPA